MSGKCVGQSRCAMSSKIGPSISWSHSDVIIGERVTDETLRDLKTHFNEQEIVDVTCRAAIINAWNRLAIALRAPPGH